MRLSPSCPLVPSLFYARYIYTYLMHLLFSTTSSRRCYLASVILNTETIPHCHLLQCNGVKWLTVKSSLHSALSFGASTRLAATWHADPNEVSFYGVSTKLFPLCMVSEWMTQGKYVRSNPEVDRVNLLTDAANGLSYLHSFNVVHGDLKGDNVLIREIGTACLCDFGLASVARTLMTSASASRGRGSI